MITIEDQITQVEEQLRHITGQLNETISNGVSYNMDLFLQLSVIDADYRQVLATLNQVQLISRMADEVEGELDFLGGTSLDDTSE